MDLTRPVIYRTLDLNDVVFDVDTPISGIAIDAVDYHGVQAVGYVEKRSLSDGLDASDVFLGGRAVSIRGSLYGVTRADLFDRLHDLRATLSPTAAYSESPGDYGYLPMDFEVPTEDTINYPTGFIPQMMRVRPMQVPDWQVMRDKIGGATELGMNIAWSCVLQAKDPRIYAQTEVTTFFDATGTHSSNSGVVRNRGAYPAPLNIQLLVPGSGAGRKYTLNGFGTSIVITVPDSANDQIARYNGAEKYLTVTEAGVETLRMDLLDIPGSVQHPLVPAGDSSYSWEVRNPVSDALVNANAQSQFWFWEAWV